MVSERSVSNSLVGSIARLRIGGWAVCLLVGWCAQPTRAQTPLPTSPRQLMTTVVDNENAAADQHEYYAYLSSERSGRTNGHLWTERVVETAPGRMRRLIAIDGQPLSPRQQQAEIARLERIEAHPDEFIQHEKNTRAEEKRAREMMEALPHDFLFDDVQLTNGAWHMHFRPDPACEPSGIEERILHQMAGTVVIDAAQLRLIHIDFHLTQDVPIGFGLLADVHTGTTFISDRAIIHGRWHTTRVVTQVRAKAVLFKTVDLNIELERRDFQPLPHPVSVAEAARMLLADTP